MFVSPKAFYLRLAAMMKARHDTPDADNLLERIAELPGEPENSNLSDYLRKCSSGRHSRLCIFGTGYHGKVLKFELEYRGIVVDFFSDNDVRKHGTLIMGTPCVSPSELAFTKSDILVIIATDVSDIIEMQLRNAGFPCIITKKQLDALILETPPNI